MSVLRGFCGRRDRSVLGCWRGTASFVLIEPVGYLGYSVGVLVCDTVNVSVDRSSWG
jgi:hypothetical protein